MANFKDHFSRRAADYASCRPSYPAALADFLVDICAEPGLAWEAGCGSGQLSLLLAQHFGRVAATDASRQQLGQASRRSNIAYWCATAEDSPLAGGTADLAVAAQAAHWFDLESYYREVRRVLRPGGAVALVTYGNVRLDDRFEPLLESYREMIASYWPPERRCVEEGYRSLPFPFRELETPALQMEADWPLDRFIGYLQTSSAVQAMLRKRGETSMHSLTRRLTSAWGRSRTTRRVRWPLTLRAGRL